jgi:hypothetical protein
MSSGSDAAQPLRAAPNPATDWKHMPLKCCVASADMGGPASQLESLGQAGGVLAIAARPLPRFVGHLQAVCDRRCDISRESRGVARLARKDFKVWHGSQQPAAERSRLQSAQLARRFLRAQCGYHLSGQRRCPAVHAAVKTIMRTADTPTTEESRP